VDVIEIDGASNNGVEQVRELRQNASLRPSRSRYKIYYIDEVHMLSTGAFNALLKTLEEPPSHVKFLFATTEANKIPITVLSRCQRYDFAGITPDAIVNTLLEICAREHVEAEPEALQVVARRAGGSMRDAQSLLEQLLASGSSRLTVELVHTLLGTPSDERLLAMLEALANRDSSSALVLFDQAAAEGVQPSDLLAGVLDFLRDAMVISIGAGAVLLSVTPRQKPRLQSIVDRWSIDAILAALQILAEARARMRGVSHGRLLAELALVRVARLENLTDLSELIHHVSELESGSPLAPRTPAQSVKKKRAAIDTLVDEIVEVSDGVQTPSQTLTKSNSQEQLPAYLQHLQAKPAVALIDARVDAAEPAVTSDASERNLELSASRRALERSSSDGMRPETDVSPQGPSDSAQLELTRIHQVWEDLVKKVGANLGIRLSQTAPIAVEGSNVLVIAARPGYNSVADVCGTTEAKEKIEQCLHRLLRRPVAVRYERSTDPRPEDSAPEPAGGRTPDPLTGDPMIQQVIELFEARPLHVEYEDGSDSN
jgi:DNA polymerase-3 subunit gamma/tau